MKMLEVFKGIGADDSKSILKAQAIIGRMKESPSDPVVLASLKNELIRLGPTAIAAINKELGKTPKSIGDSFVQKIILRALPSIKSSESVDALIKILSSNPDYQVRAFCAESLGKLRSIKAISILSETLLYDGSLLVRENAAYSLGQLGTDSVIPLLSDTMKNDMNKSLRYSAMHGLAALGSKNANLQLMNALKKSQDETLRFFIIEKFGEKQSAESVGPLVYSALNDKDYVNRNYALYFLADIAKANILDAKQIRLIAAAAKKVRAQLRGQRIDLSLLKQIRQRLDEIENTTRVRLKIIPKKIKF